MDNVYIDYGDNTVTFMKFSTEFDNSTVRFGPEIIEDSFNESYTETGNSSLANATYAIMSFISTEMYYLKRIQLLSNYDGEITIKV